MSSYEIHQAFTQAVIDLSLGIPLAHENSDYDPLANKTLYANLTLLDGDVESMGKSLLDADDNRGIYQISLYDVSGGSIKAIRQLRDTITQYFKFSRQLTAGSQTVELIGTSATGGRNTGGWYVIDISIAYSAYINRV